jgi:hypothetical protein
MIGPVLLSAVMSWQMHVRLVECDRACHGINEVPLRLTSLLVGRAGSIRTTASAADESTTPDEHGAWLSHALIGAYVAASATDLSTTMFCRGAKSCVELNPALRPLQDRPLAFGLVKGAASAAIAYLLIRVHRTHPRVVRVVAGVLAAGSFAIAVRNEREAR